MVDKSLIQEIKKTLLEAANKDIILIKFPYKKEIEGVLFYLWYKGDPFRFVFYKDSKYIYVIPEVVYPKQEVLKTHGFKLYSKFKEVYREARFNKVFVGVITQAFKLVEREEEGRTQRFLYHMYYPYFAAEINTNVCKIVATEYFFNKYMKPALKEENLAFIIVDNKIWSDLANYIIKNGSLWAGTPKTQIYIQGGTRYLFLQADLIEGFSYGYVVESIPAEVALTPI